MRFKKFAEIVSIISQYKSFTTTLHQQYKIDYRTFIEVCKILEKLKFIRKIDGKWVVEK